MEQKYTAEDYPWMQVPCIIEEVKLAPRWLRYQNINVFYREFDYTTAKNFQD